MGERTWFERDRPSNPVSETEPQNPVEPWGMVLTVDCAAPVSIINGKCSSATFRITQGLTSGPACSVPASHHCGYCPTGPPFGGGGYHGAGVEAGTGACAGAGGAACAGAGPDGGG